MRFFRDQFFLFGKIFIIFLLLPCRGKKQYKKEISQCFPCIEFEKLLFYHHFYFYFFFSGKSTIAGLIERFYDVHNGEIMIDGINIKQLDPSWLRGDLIGYINQVPQNFDKRL